MNLASAKSPTTGRVISNDLCMNGKSNSFVRHTVLDVTGTPLEGNFLVGQSFGVIAPGEDENGKPHKVRLYSIACPSAGEDGQGKHVSTTPKRLIEEYWPQKPDESKDRHDLFLGVCSNFLCDLEPGAEVTITGPSGRRFLLPQNPDDHDYIFLATGTGIAPFRGMAMELMEGIKGKVSGQVHLLMGAPYTTDLLYHDVFTRLADEHENFHYEWAISRERRPDGRRGLYVHQLIEEQIDKYRELLASPRTLIYICGLAGMQVGLFKILASAGLGDGYLTVKDPLTGVDPADWESAQIKRSVRPAPRCLVEVY